MKDIGRTNEGDYIVELSHGEYSTIYELQRVIEGAKSADFYSMYPELLKSSGDLSPLFMAIRTWIEGEYYINALQDYVGKLKSMMKLEV